MNLTVLTVSCQSSVLATTSDFRENRWARRRLSMSLPSAIRPGLSSSSKVGRWGVKSQIFIGLIIAGACHTNLPVAWCKEVVYRAHFWTVVLDKVGNAWVLLPLAMLHILQMIQKAGYGDTLEDGPQSSWLGYSLLPEGFFLWFFTRNLQPSWSISI